MGKSKWACHVSSTASFLTCWTFGTKDGVWFGRSIFTHFQQFTLNRIGEEKRKMKRLKELRKRFGNRLRDQEDSKRRGFFSLCGSLVVCVLSLLTCLRSRSQPSTQLIFSTYLCLQDPSSILLPVGGDDDDEWWEDLVKKAFCHEAMVAVIFKLFNFENLAVFRLVPVRPMLRNLDMLPTEAGHCRITHGLITD